MSPLRIEVFSPIEKDWIKIGDLQPTDRPGSMSNNKPDGGRDVYIFECAKDDSKSTIFRSGFGIDTEVEKLREIKTTGLEVMKELKDGEFFEIDMKTDRSSESIKTRFTHIKNNH